MATAVAIAPASQLDELHDLAERLDDVIAELDTSRCDSHAALGLLGVFSRVRKAASTGEALVAARVDECSAHEQTDHRSTAHLVADLGGTTIAKAREVIDTAKRLRDCAATEEALRSGTVSIEQAAAVTAAAAVNPAAERDLLKVADTESLKTLTQHARQVKLTARNDRMGVYRRQCAARSLKHWIADDGMVCGRFQLPPDTGAAVVNTLERRADREFKKASREGRREDSDRYLADALVSAVAGDSDESTSRSTEVVVHVSHDALLRGSVDTSPESGEICMIQGVGPIPVEIAREIAEDAFLKGVLVDGKDVVKVKHFGRKIPAAVRTALEVREVVRHGDVRCSSETCDATLGLEWDHREPVARNGPTSYDNLQPLCRPHHRAKTRRDGRSPP